MADNEFLPGPRSVDVMMPAELVQAVWREIKTARDQATHERAAAAWRERKLDDLLTRMKEAGMAGWIPTLDEVRAAWAGEELQKPE